MKIVEIVQELKFERDWTELLPKMCSLILSWTKYLEKSKEIQ